MATSAVQRTRPGPNAASHVTLARSGSSARADAGTKAAARTIAPIPPKARLNVRTLSWYQLRMRNALSNEPRGLAALAALSLFGLGAFAACKEPRSDPAPPIPAAATALAVEDGSAPNAEDAGAAPRPASTWDGSMPERPVPKTSPTVGAGMPAETQMKAIAYMTAMSQPSVDDPYVDADFVSSLVEQVKPVALALDKGNGADKQRLNRVEVIGGGRRIDLLLASGCDAQLPTKAVVGRANVPLATLHAHGVLVISCHDARVQCLQSTRDATDVLCTTAPRKR